MEERLKAKQSFGRLQPQSAERGSLVSWGPFFEELNDYFSGCFKAAFFLTPQ